MRHGAYSHVDRRGRVHTDPDEQSVFDTLLAKAYSLESEKEAREFIDTATLRMVMFLKLPRTKTSEIVCKAFLVDSFDLRIDLNPPDENDHWRWSKRFPRLSKLANADHGAFEIFLKVIAATNLPDLTKPQKTAKEVKEEKTAEIAYLRKQVAIRKKPAKSPAETASKICKGPSGRPVPTTMSRTGFSFYFLLLP